MLVDRTYIIAEAGVNHNGNLEAAMDLVRIAIDAGANAVKFQTFKADNLVTRNAEKADYQTKAGGEKESHYEMIKRLELSFDSHKKLLDYCKDSGIDFLSSPFDIDSLNMLLDMGLKKIKIPSGEITNMPYLQAIGKANKEVIMSTGMSTLLEVEEALDIIISSGTSLDKITVLHTNTEYPTPYKDAKLKAMLALRKKFNCKVGYSDHTPGIEAPIAAVALGASIIEKHFTRNKKDIGPDHSASLAPEELKAMVNAIRNIELALGKEHKEPSLSELKNIVIVRKSIVALRDIEKGELFSPDNLTVKRPGSGLSPMKWNDVIGQTASRSYKQDDQIQI